MMCIVELALLWHVLLYSNFTIPPDNSRSLILKTECWVHWKDEAFTFFFISIAFIMLSIIRL